MPHQNLERLYSSLGFVVWGDLGPVTLYRNKRGKVVFFAKTWPHKPGSPAQLAQREKFIQAAAAWHALTSVARAEWEQATRRASLCLTGYDLFLHWSLTADDRAIRTLEHQTATKLLQP